VLTDEQSFRGTRLAAAGTCRCALPWIRKDFLLDPLQVIRPAPSAPTACCSSLRRLLPAKLGNWPSWRTSWHDVLVEVHDRTELEACAAEATAAGAAGINNRTCAPSRPGWNHAGAAAADTCRLPGDPKAASSRRGVARMQAARCGASLIGESLMRQPSPGAALKELLSPLFNSPSQGWLGACQDDSA